MGGAWHGAGRELFLGLGPNNRNNGNNGVWLAVVVLVVSNRLLFKPGSQGGEFYVENVFEEWGAPNEWFFDTTTQQLYYYYNGTTSTATDGSAPPSIPSDVVFEATNVAGLVSIHADMSNPAKNISFKGIGFKDTIYTYLDPHEMPSGGDWSLQVGWPG